MDNKKDDPPVFFALFAKFSCIYLSGFSIRLKTIPDIKGSLGFIYFWTHKKISNVFGSVGWKKIPEMSETALWRPQVRQMALQQSSQINMTLRKERASLGKGYRTVAAASCVLGQRMMCQCGQSWPPHTRHWKLNRGLGIAMSWEAFSAITVKWNWPWEQTRSLPISC